MGEPEPDSTTQGPGRGPVPLGYAGPNAPEPRGPIGELLSLGCIYAFVATLVSFAIMASARDSAIALYLALAILLGGPFIVSLCVRGWRAFALGIAIMVGVVVLIVGTCGVLLFH